MTYFPVISFNWHWCVYQNHLNMIRGKKQCDELKTLFLFLCCRQNIHFYEEITKFCCNKSTHFFLSLVFQVVTHQRLIKRIDRKDIQVHWMHWSHRNKIIHANARMQIKSQSINSSIWFLLTDNSLVSFGRLT